MITGSGECAQLIIFIKLALVYTGQMMVGLACWLVGLAFHSWCLTKHLYGSSISSSLHWPLQHESEIKVLNQPWMKYGFLILYLQMKNSESFSLQRLITLLITTRSGTRVLTIHISQSTVRTLQDSSILTATLLLADTSSVISKVERQWLFISRQCPLQTTNTTFQSHLWFTICGQRFNTMASTSPSKSSRLRNFSKQNAYLLSGTELICCPAII